MSSIVFFTKEEWFSLPLAERQRWWEATDYGRKYPSRQTINRYIKLIEEAKNATNKS